MGKRYIKVYFPADTGAKPHIEIYVPDIYILAKILESEMGKTLSHHENSGDAYGKLE